MFTSGTLVAVNCAISRGGFSSERVFRITLADGEEHVGAAPVQYFFDETATRLSPDKPLRGETLLGLVTGRVVDTEGQDVYLVSVPSGEVLRVNSNIVVEHPKERRAHVSVQS
jgi:hypothetical protein